MNLGAKNFSRKFTMITKTPLQNFFEALQKIVKKPRYIFLLP